MITSGEVKLLYRSNVESVNVVWKTKNFILFAAFGPLVRRKIVIQSITKLLTWLRKGLKILTTCSCILNSTINLLKKKRTRPFCYKRLLFLKSASTSIIYHH